MIQVQHLTKVYKIYEQPADRLKQAIFRGRKKFYKEFWPVTDVSFSINKGEIVGLIGANGSGKSTLLQLICGILQPTHGEIKVEGRVAALLELGSGFNPEFTGHDNIFMNAALLGLSTEQIKARYSDIVAFADIGDFIHQPVKTYSSGMIVRLAFAVSSFVDADVLVVDEALSVGDVGFQAKCLERMERLMNQGVTVLLVTHDVQLVKRYCNRVLFLNHGNLAFDGDPEQGVELYLYETRERKSATYALQADSSLKHQYSSFGSIVKTGFMQEGELSPVGIITQGERAKLYVQIRVDASIKSPKIQMTIRDSRGYNLFGYNNLFDQKQLQPDADGNISVCYSFKAALQLGEYSVTLRLDDTDDVDQVNLLDKQVGLLSFTVVAPYRTFDAVVDLGGACEVLS